MATTAPAKVEKEHAKEVSDFRVASLVTMAIGLVLIITGAARDSRAMLEIGGAIAGFAFFFRLAIEFVPGMHAKAAYLHPKHFFLATWRSLDEEAVAPREALRASGRYDYDPVIALCVGAVALAVMEYFGHTIHFAEWVDALAPEFRYSPWFQLGGYAWWSFFRVLGYLIIPMVVIKFVFKERIKDHGLKTEGFLQHAWIYALSYIVVLLCVVLVSRHDAHFQTYYPFYSLANRSWLDFISWELLYAAQFFSLEFFFRGFWLKSMKSSMGSYAIFAMVVPYCMIHFGKPFLETMAAIVAGVVLGTLSMKTRSIWSGFLIHVSVAVSMDMAALLATRGLPTAFWPDLP